ncbi:acyl-[acyl-carrier-protein] thioesterase [Pontiella sp.]|uniref:acyl-[acyl-carrier-protein] thioesterase n=1 Tax=Pontiella sp. TaxID=2837462 RepID=UPI00356B5806
MSDQVKSEWKAEHVIRSYEVDPSGVARLSSFCRFMQEAAYLHAEHLGVGHSQLSQQGISWVLARMRIEVARLPKWGEPIRLRTWPSSRDRLFFYRDFEIADGDGRRLMQAGTAWFVIDIQKRERMIPDWWTTAEYPIGGRLFDAKLGRLKSCGCEGGESMPVRYGDLDQNGHVNNVRYIEWMLDGLPPEFHQTHVLQSLEVNYLAEAVYGHQVSVCCNEIEPRIFEHGIRANDAELFRARSVWAAR